MIYVCIKCGDRWTVQNCSDEISGGLCETCITAYIREKQQFHGLQDCFKRATEECPKRECSYWSLCNKDIVKRGKACCR